MEILITDSKAISEIQKEFSKEFPFLKLEFFDAVPKEEKAQPKSKMFPHDSKLGVIRRKRSDGKISITKTETVSALEKKLWKTFGLSVQVFRKSGNLWIETSLTDSWTLEQQNREGFEMSNPQHKNPYQQASDEDVADRDKW